MKTSSVRLLLNGQNLNLENTIDSLDINNGDVIEAFEELLGGGPPTKRNMFGNVKKILETLDALQDTDGTTSDSSLDMKDDIDETNRVSNTDQDWDINAKMEGSEKKEKGEQDTLWLEELQRQFQNGDLTPTNEFHKQIIFYLQLPQLSQVEMEILKKLADRLGMYSEWQREKNETFPIPHKSKKRTPKTHDACSRNLRSKKNVEVSEESIVENNQVICGEAKEKEASGHLIDFDNQDIIENVGQEDEMEMNQRGNLLERFGIISPILKQTSQ
jgi:hypothetical protein